MVFCRLPVYFKTMQKKSEKIMTKDKPLGRPKKFENPKRVSVAMDSAMLENIKKEAIYMSSIEGKLLTVNEMVRRAVNICYPQRKQEQFKF